MAEPTPNPTKTTEPTPPTPPEPPAPNNDDNQKAIDEAIAKVKAEWEKEVEEKLKKQRQSLNVKKSLHMPKRNLPKTDCLPRLQSTLWQKIRIAQRRLLTR